MYSSEGVLRGPDVAQPLDGLPVFWWRSPHAALMAGTHLSPDARELGGAPTPPPADALVSFVSPPSRGRFCYDGDSEEILRSAAARAQYCCVALSTEVTRPRILSNSFALTFFATSDGRLC